MRRWYDFWHFVAWHFDRTFEVWSLLQDAWTIQMLTCNRFTFHEIFYLMFLSLMDPNPWIYVFLALYFGESLENTNFGDLWPKILLEIVAPPWLWRPSQLSFVTLEYKFKNSKIFSFKLRFYLLLFTSARWRRRHQQLQIANFSSGKSGVFSLISNTINSNQVSLWLLNSPWKKKTFEVCLVT